MKKFSINQSIAVLAFVAAITSMAATFVPSSAPALSIVSTISGAASTIISVYQPNQPKMENIKIKTETKLQKENENTEAVSNV
jgi:hypothetical protein